MDRMSSVSGISIDLLPHTVVTMVGPTMSGKSFLANQLAEQLRAKYPLVSVVLISSDEIRRRVLGSNLDKYASEMLYASEAAFTLLFKELEVAITYPQSLRNALVIVDTTGLSDEFRLKVNELALANSYHTATIVHDYKGGPTEYLRYVDDPSKFTTDLVSSHLTRLRTKALPKIRAKDYDAGVFRIKSKDFSTITPSIINYHLIEQAHLVGDKHLVVGDPHGNYKALLNLMSRVGVELVDGQLVSKDGVVVVLLGDYLDKYPSLEEQVALINLIHDNPEVIKTIRGNHESFVVRYLRGEIKDEKSLTYFETVDLLREDSMLRAKVEATYDRSPYYFIHRDFVLTHSPCKYQYIGKLDNYSVRHQLKLRYPHREDYESLELYERALEAALSFVREQSSNNFPAHVTGHIPVASITKVHSQYLIDTGATYGNKLSGLCFRGSNRPEYLEVMATSACVDNSYRDGLPTIFSKSKLTEVEVSDRDMKRITFLTKSDWPANYLSPTMSPSASKGGELEPLESAIEYYHSKGVRDLVVQPKWMGSFSTMYIRRAAGDSSESTETKSYRVGEYEVYFLSRNGYLIDHVDLSDLAEEWVGIVTNKYPDLDYIILGGELLPWSVLGQGLIDHHFLGTYSTNKGELDFLKSNGFYSAMSRMEEESLPYVEDRVLNRADRDKKYGAHRVEWYESLIKLRKYQLDLGVSQHCLAKFKDQIDLHGGSGKPYYEPFSILKWRMRGEKEVVLPMDNYDSFTCFNDDDCLLISSGSESDLVGAKYFYEGLVTQGYEGVVIKPVDSRLRDVIPAMKVRNEEYLRVVYGPFYSVPSRYEGLVRSKNTRGKLTQSREQWALGLSMLSVPYDEINTSEGIKSDFIRFLGVEKRGAGIDPRL